MAHNHEPTVSEETCNLQTTVKRKVSDIEFSARPFKVVRSALRDLPHIDVTNKGLSNLKPETTQTTNACQSFHAHFKNNFSSPHPNIYVFLDVLLDLQSEIYAKINCEDEVHTPRNAVVQRQRWVQKLISLHRAGQISDYQYVKRVCAKYRPHHDEP